MYQISFKVNGKFFNSEVYTDYFGVEEMYQTLILSEYNEEVIITELNTQRTYYGFIDEALSDAAAEDEDEYWVDLSGRQFNKYGRGYMLYPLGKKDIYYGEKYLMNGWWNKTEKGWFFKKQFYDELIEHNAKPMGWENRLSGVETPKAQVKTEDEWIDLTGRQFKEYGRGFILISLKKDCYLGKKYLLNGWWMEKEKGWFFKKEFWDELIDHDAVPVPEYREYSAVQATSKGWTETDVTTKAKAKTPKMTIKQEPLSESDSDYLPEKDVQEPDEEFESDEEVDTDMSNMVFMKYGKGYILKTHKKDCRYGADYFMDGFWNDKAKGWFFKKEFKKTMKKNGATYIKLTT